jgi:hypothetical protein
MSYLNVVNDAIITGNKEKAIKAIKSVQLENETKESTEIDGVTFGTDDYKAFTRAETLELLNEIMSEAFNKKDKETYLLCTDIMFEVGYCSKDIVKINYRYTEPNGLMFS